MNLVASRMKKKTFFLNAYNLLNEIYLWYGEHLLTGVR